MGRAALGKAADGDVIEVLAQRLALVKRPPLERYETLLNELMAAEGGVREGKDGLIASLLALRAVVTFLSYEPLANGMGLHLPISRLANAIHDLTKGGKPAMLFNRPRVTSNRPRDLAVSAAKGALAAALEILVRSKFPRKQAAAIVAREATRTRVLGSVRQTITPRQVMAWRDEMGGRANPIALGTYRQICGEYKQASLRVPLRPERFVRGVLLGVSGAGF